VTTGTLIAVTSALDIPSWVEISAIAFGAVAGALTGLRVRFDIAGVLFLAVACGLGGGLLRDVLLQRGTPVALTDRWFLPTTLAAGFVGVILGRVTEAVKNRFGLTFVLIDAICLAAFAIVGADRAVAAGLPSVSCVLVGVIAGTGGAIIRDVVVNEPPSLFLPGSFYTLAAGGGCAVYVVGLRAEVAPVPLAVACGAAIVGVRLLSTHREWRTNPAESLDLSHRVARIRRRTPD
jgi:uncharacterized membrane protein YeiH